MKTLHIKIVKIIAYILFIGVILLHIIPFPINRDLEAVEIKLNDPSYLETRSIHVTGTYRLNLFGRDTFKGKIYIPEYEFTSQEMLEIEFMEDPHLGEGDTLIYKKQVDTDVEGKPLNEFYSFGRFISKPFLFRSAILVYDKNKDGAGGWQTDSGYCIVASASDREEALEILKKHGIYPPED